MVGLWVLLALAGGLLLIVAIVVATPAHLRLVAEVGEHSGFRAEVRTLWGLSPRLKLEGGGGGAASERPRRRRRRAKRKRTGKKRGGMSAERVLRVLNAVPEALSTALRRVRIDRLRLRAVFGFDDPADTGQVFGLLTPLVYGLPWERVDIGVEPDFDGRRFDGSAEISLHFTPIAVAWPVLRLGMMVWRLKA